MLIEVPNFTRYNPRGYDSKRPSWFRFENDFFFSISMFGLSKDERIVWLFILCCCSKKNSGTIELDPKYISKHTEVEERSVLLALKKLEEKQCIGKTRAGVERDKPATNERTNERTNKENNAIQLPLSAGDKQPCAGELLAKVWNENCGKLPKVRGLNSNRKKQARSRLQENDDLGYWQEVVKRLANSSFCRGEGGRGWIATFDWLLKPDSHLNTIEGKYDDRNKSSTKRRVFDSEKGLVEVDA